MLAGLYRLAPDPSHGRPLLPRLDDSARALDDAYRFLSTAVTKDAPAVGSEDWLRDNHHVVQDQVREIRQDLPRQYYQELPKLVDGPFAGYPRVYAFARELITHTAGRLDLQTLVDFAAAYQRVESLTIGEIWAIAIMLRLALVEELRRLADDVVAARSSRDRARAWGVQLNTGMRDPERVIEAMLREEAGDGARLSAAFVVELLHWLRDQPSSAAPAWHALQRALEAQDDSPDEMLRLEHQREAAGQLAIGNIITTMRLLSSIDWPLFFERVSLVEQILREDPAGAYAKMDFATRDRYRHSVEQLARGAKASEQNVARQAVDLAAAARLTSPALDRMHHVGYYLISRGRFRLEHELHYPPTLQDRFVRFFYGHPVIGYLSTIAFVTALAVASLVSYSLRHGGSTLDLWLTAFIVVLPVSELAISLINLVVTTQVTPRPLPKLDMRDGIPPSDRTMVVVPAIVDSEARLKSLLDDLEVRFFANRDPHLHFALLSDFADASHAIEPADGALIDAAQQRINELNQLHGSDRFFFFHRSRQWNPGEGRWMGAERKRGKLAELNRLLRGATDTSYVVQHGDVSILPSIRYVITLDSDTQLPMEAGRQLVGTLAHPLNRPRFDRQRGRVTEGYGVLQPRISVSVVSANRTMFSRVFSGHVGVDPYTTAVSDLYQDMFHEGSYVGKGIYDVDAFEAALAGRVPENTLLSHDLFEGFYARAGLVTDTDLVDDYPAHYLAFAARQHRWVRGDWQIARWFWRTVPTLTGETVPNTLPVISRWKILDNLRRSLIPPALVLLLAAGWSILPGSPALWTTLVALVLAFPAYIQLARSLGSHAPGVPLREHLRAEADAMSTSLRQAVFTTVILAHQSAGDARRNRTSDVPDACQPPQTARVGHGRPRRQRPRFGLGRGTPYVAGSGHRGRDCGHRRNARAWPPAAGESDPDPVVHLAGAGLRDGPAAAASRGDAGATRTSRAARGSRVVPGASSRSWSDPPTTGWSLTTIRKIGKTSIAHRTSPTNIGLQLLSTLAAYDLGYVSYTGMLDRLEPTFDTLLRMQRYRGHFYNWYDTRTLAPLTPAYISTVDSGNLAGYLLTLRSGLTAMADSVPLIDDCVLEGLEDVVGLFEAEIDALGRGRAAGPLKREISSLRTHLARRPATLLEWRRLLTQLEERLQAVSILFHDLEDPLLDTTAADALPAALTEAAGWLERAAAVVSTRQVELELLTGWMTRLQAAGIRDLPADVPSLDGLIALCDAALTEPGSNRRAAGRRASAKACRGVGRARRAPRRAG